MDQVWFGKDEAKAVAAKVSVNRVFWYCISGLMIDTCVLLWLMVFYTTSRNISRLESNRPFILQEAVRQFAMADELNLKDQASQIEKSRSLAAATRCKAPQLDAALGTYCNGLPSSFNGRPRMHRYKIKGSVTMEAATA